MTVQVVATVSSQPEKLLGRMQEAGVVHNQVVEGDTIVRVGQPQMMGQPATVFFCAMPALENIVADPTSPGDGQPLPWTLADTVPVVTNMIVSGPGYWKMRLRLQANGALNVQMVGEPELVHA